ncbi:MAG: CaiB/BaiF CoA transferase family protein [Cumulibacter sp.]
MTVPRPLDGMLVLDLTTMIAGPLAGLVLADLGAEVIKIESPAGDGSRGYFTADPQVRLNSMTAAYNRGKRALVVDLTDPDDHALVLRMAARADVVLQGFRPGVVERLGISYEDIKAINADVIYLSISGFGQDGPDARRAGMDSSIQAETGLMHVTGEPDGNPQRVGSQVVDIGTGHVAAQAILAALLNRERHGIGEHIECSLLATAIGLQAHNITEYLTAGVDLKRSGSHPEFTTPSGLYSTQDGWIMFSANTPRHWAAFVEAVEAPDLGENPAYADQGGRTAHRDQLIPRIAEILAKRSTDEWIERFTKANIVFGRVRDYPDLAASAQFAAGEFAIEVEYAGEVTKTVRLPARYSSFAPAASGGSPALGADSDAIRTEYQA